MSDIEFFSNLKPQRLASLDEDFKHEQSKFPRDELNRTMRLSGNSKLEPQETIYKRFPEET